MAKISANYEVVYIIDPAQGEEAVAATVAKFQTLAEQHASNVVVDEWGKRRLAYAINYKTEGYYVLMSFTCGPEFPKELDRGYYAFHDRLQGRVRENSNAESDHHYGSADP